MAWHYTATPDQVQPELGPDLLDGDYSTANPSWAYTAGTYSVTGGGGFAFADGDPHLYLTLTPDAVYTVTVEVRGADAVSWGMVLQNSEQEQVEIPVGDVDATPTDDWVTVRADWRAPLDPLNGSPAVTATGPGMVEIRNPVMAVQTGRVILTVPGDVIAETIMASGGIVAGAPNGARVELTQDGLVAYDATSTRTAHIAGEGGEFVGGSFRTSDNLPGQVRIADDALTYSGQSIPGIEITPEDTQYTVLPAGVGPWGTGAALRGGEDTSGRSSTIHATPTQAGITSTSPTGGAQFFASSHGISAGSTRTSDGGHGHLSVDYTGGKLAATDGETGENGEITALPRDLRMTLRDGSGNTSGQIRVAASTSSIINTDPDGRATEISVGSRSGALISHTGTDGTERQFRITPHGFYLITNPGSSEVRTNLETLASDVQDLKARVAALEA